MSVVHRGSPAVLPPGRSDTEDPKNVPLYQHCGYETTSHERVTDDLETWIFFRRDDASA